jgi:hypothetical protein
MKNRRLIAKLLSLAMIFALMIPAPVAAKSSKGGKLVKSVTEYRYNETKGRWEKALKTNYTYNKKAYPKEIKDTSYSGYFFGIPTDASVYVYTTKYKFKGKTPKSMKLKNPAGVVEQVRKYKKGRLTNVTSTSKSSWDDDKGYEINNGATAISYNKKGLAVYEAGTSNGTSVYESGSSASTGTTARMFAVTHKKGIPSRIETTYTSNSTTTYSAGWEPDVESNTSRSYTNFNKKGLTIESGYFDSTTQQPKANYIIQYKSKKGNVKTATVFMVKDNGTTVPVRMYSFKYNKTKISKARYFNMINSIVGYHNAFFSWF